MPQSETVKSIESSVYCGKTCSRRRSVALISTRILYNGGLHKAEQIKPSQHCEIYIIHQHVRLLVGAGN